MAQAQINLIEALNQLSDVRQDIIRKEAEIESIYERIDALDADDRDNLHRAKTKLRHEKDRMVELKCHAAKLEIDVILVRGGHHV